MACEDPCLCSGSIIQTVEGTLGRVVKCVDGWPCENAFGMPARPLLATRDEGDFCKVTYRVTVTWCVPDRRGYVCECLCVFRRGHNVFVCLLYLRMCVRK